MLPGVPPKQGLYDPQFERDSCGVGFVVDVRGRKSNGIVRQALQVLINMLHRGAKGSEANTGDGAGILIQVPHQFLRGECDKVGIRLPAPGDYGVGMVSLPRNAESQRRCEELFASEVQRTGQVLLGWRDVPTNNSTIGDSAKSVEPVFRQVLIQRGNGTDPGTFERKLFLIRRRAEHSIGNSGVPEANFFYISSLSSNTVIYKGMLSADQIETYFPDLADPRVESALAVVHQRFSTNTFPSWPLAHPFRYVSHNGEINTLLGNKNWMKAREAQFASELFGDDIKDLLPVIVEGGSDSAMLDNALEMLVMCGRSLPHAMMMLIPEAHENHPTMSDDKRAFYEFHSCLMEPWDGPASIVFTNGVQIGAVLDRNGLRPSRYYVLKDGLVVMASEVGVLDIPPEDVVQKGRLQPGKMFLIDTSEGRIIGDKELKQRIISEKPYRQWLRENMIRIKDLPEAQVPEPDHPTVMERQIAFGYTHEDLRILMAPMAKNGEEPIGSMGTDTPLAVLSDRSQPLFNYFKQLFAQVTNPPLDAIREELVTSMTSALGPERNLLKAEPESARLIKILSPIMDNDDLARLRYIDINRFKPVTLPMVFDSTQDGEGLRVAMNRLCELARKAIEDGAGILILSDRDTDKDHAPIPSLLATSGLHHFLVREGLRTRATLIVECGDAREVHHYCLLIGYGASAINPYLAFETLDDMIRQHMLEGMDHRKAVNYYVKAVNKGVLKVMSKMGISTLQSYRGAQIFEAIGLSRAFVDTYFTNTPSRLEGIGVDEVAEEVLQHHRRAYPKRLVRRPDLDWGGNYQWRQDGEYHMYNPETIHKLQYATRSNNYRIFKEYSALMNSTGQRLCTLRGMFDLRYAPEEIPLSEVEPVESIMKRFATGAMSFGSISKEAHETLAIAMNRIGAKSNTGEGGEDAARYIPDANGDSRSSAIKQVASGRFGVTSEYLVSAQELQIKMAQGAKPGEGGQLPGHKVDRNIARVRHSTPGVGLISPPPHHDIYSIEDLAQLIYDLKNANPRARISVKLVAEVGVGTVAAGVAKAHADVVLISGDSGGTGASPVTGIKHAGIPWELGLAEAHQVLLLNDLRSRIIVQTDGQLKTGRDVVVAALLGAEEFGFATSALIVSGCIMMRVCHLNTCPVGVATQNPALREKFTGKPEYIVNYFRMIAEEVRELMAKLGFRTINEMVGRMDRLDVRKAVDHWKAKKLDLSAIFHLPEVSPGQNCCAQSQDHGIHKALDNLLIELAVDSLLHAKPVDIRLPIRNVNRTVGTMLGSEVTRRYGRNGLPDNTIRIHFTGSAGQSFGAFLPNGISLTLEGDSNDYMGKGLSGGKIAVYPPAASTFPAEENIIIGNVALYGATGGEAFICGVAGERFAVRNSGAVAVVEGVGDHGCEYMTRGHVVVLGRTGRNFAAGMSGGQAYVIDEEGDFAQRCNLEMVDLETFADAEEERFVRGLIERHVQRTGSRRGSEVLAKWEQYREKFQKVMPLEYRRVLNEGVEAKAKAATVSR
jgi:glutamate synthase domain-containing protein 2/glutamate synthase domain-containing protein 1/glutamate synthase domain-containing protein 3